MHMAFESLWPQSLPIITSTSTWVPHAVLRLCVLIPPVRSMARQGFWTPVRMTQTITSQNLGRRGCCPCHGGGGGVAAFYQSVLERHRLEIETLARC
jgi:hypothetical protein